MQKQLYFSILTLLAITVVVALLAGWSASKPLAEVNKPLAEVSKPLAEGMGRVVLKVTDLDSGEPIPGVEFVIENVWAEMWASPVGKSDSKGQVQFESKERKGYEYYIWTVPSGYEEAGDGDGRVPTAIRPGKTVVHRFHLRKRPSAR